MKKGTQLYLQPDEAKFLRVAIVNMLEDVEEISSDPEINWAPHARKDLKEMVAAGRSLRIKLEKLGFDMSDLPPFLKKSVQTKMQTLAEKNKNEIDARHLLDPYRTPTAEELNEMRQWAIDYKRANKRASKREVRKATQAHFNIKIYR